MELKTYDPDLVDVIVGSFPMTGFADGDMITVERDVERYLKHKGAKGAISRAKQLDKSAIATIMLASTSPSNDILSAFMIADEVNNDGIFPLLVKDGSGRTLVSAPECWVEKEPPMVKGKEVSEFEWTIAIAKLEIFIGGN